MNFRELPVAIAGVIPIILEFFLAKSKRVNPKTSWYLGAWVIFGFGIKSPVFALNLPGAWYFTWFCSACFSPFPFVVITCKNLGPLIFFNLFNSVSKSLKLCPSIGPEYSKFKASKILCLSFVSPFLIPVKYFFKALIQCDTKKF